jgi:hypothetical protein
MVIGQVAEVADPYKASWQHVLKKPAEELFGTERHFALLVTVHVVFPAECNLVTVVGEQAMITDGDAMGVPPQIT